MNKKTLLALPIIAATILVGTAAIGGSTTIFDAVVSNKVYQTTWSKAPTKVGNQTFVYGQELTPIEVKMSGLHKTQNGLVSLNKFGSFKNVTPIGTIQKITVKVNKAGTNEPYTGENLLIKFGHKNPGSDKIEYTIPDVLKNSIDFTSIVNKQPSYFEIINYDAAALDIAELTISYGCKVHDEAYHNYLEFEESKFNAPENYGANNLFCQPHMSNGYATDGLGVGVVYQFDLDSSKADNASAIIRINNQGVNANMKTSDVFNVRINGETAGINLDYKRSSYHIWPFEADWRWEYYGMVNMYATLPLKQGKNIVEFEIKAEHVNADCIDLITDSVITNNTIGTLSGDKAPKVEIIKMPTLTTQGTIRTSSVKEGSASRDDILPTLNSRPFFYQSEITNDVETLTYELFGNKFTLWQASAVENDQGELKNNYFEFENSNITKGETRGKGHVCSDSLLIAPVFKGGIALNVMSAATYTFNIHSDRTVRAPIDIILDRQKMNDQISDAPFITRVNGEPTFLDLRYKPDMTEHYIANDPGYTWMYFKMVTAKGFITLHEGDNLVEIETKDIDTNLDSLIIKTSANLTDKTVPTFSGDRMPEFVVTKAPTANANGSISVIANKAAHGGESINNSGILPPLTNPDYLKEETDTTITYYLNLLNTKVVIATVNK